jgi:hypothetical protein
MNCALWYKPHIFAPVSVLTISVAFLRCSVIPEKEVSPLNATIKPKDMGSPQNKVTEIETQYVITVDVWKIWKNKTVIYLVIFIPT